MRYFFIGVVSKAELDFDPGAIDHDEHFYGGLRAVQDRIEILKRRHKRVELAKTIGIAVMISILALAFLFHRIHQTTSLSPSESLATTSGILLSDNLTFENATLASIFDVLRSRYDVRIDVISPGLLSCRFTGTFYHGMLVDEMLDTLARSEGVEFAFKQPRTFEMSGKGCAM